MARRKLTVDRYAEIKRRLAEGRGVRDSRALGCSRRFCRNKRWRLRDGALMSAIRKPGNKTDQRRTRLLRHGNRSAPCGSCASFRCRQ